MPDAIPARGQSIDAVVANFQRRIMQDALSEATALYWLRRADQLEAARPRPGDFHGAATREDLSARHATLTLAALNCRRHAELLRGSRGL